MEVQKVLIVTTSHNALGNTGEKTGVWLEELAAPYYVFYDEGASITIASPKGGEVPLDPKSEQADTLTPASIRFQQDMDAMERLKHAIPLKEIKEEEFDAVFLPGGHGPMWDLVKNKPLKSLLEAFNNHQKPMGFVCHGVVGLVSLQNEEGEPFVKGLKLTSFSDSEEKAVGLSDIVPFLLESKLRSLGAKYTKGPDFTNYVVADGNVITGQNPASSVDAAIEILSMIISKRKTVTY
jgi:putative intracellular protease/amidase